MSPVARPVARPAAAGVALALLALAPAAGSAQAAAIASIPAVGARVRVTLVAAEAPRPRSFGPSAATMPAAPPLVGTVMPTATGTLGLATRHRTWTMPWSAVEMLEVSRARPRMVGAVRGLGTGAAIGALAEATSGFPGDDRLAWTPRGALVAGAIGFVVGFVRGAEDWERMAVPAR